MIGRDGFLFFVVKHRIVLTGVMETCRACKERWPSG